MGVGRGDGVGARFVGFGGMDRLYVGRGWSINNKVEGNGNGQGVRG